MLKVKRIHFVPGFGNTVQHGGEGMVVGTWEFATLHLLSESRIPLESDGQRQPSHVAPFYSAHSHSSLDCAVQDRFFSIS